MNEYGKLNGIPIDPDPSMPDGQKRWEIVPETVKADTTTEHTEDGLNWFPLFGPYKDRYLGSIRQHYPEILAFRRPTALKEAGAGSLETVQSKAREWLKELPAFNTHGENVAIHCARRHLAELTQLRTLAKDQGEALEKAEEALLQYKFGYEAHTVMPADYFLKRAKLTDNALTLIAKLKGKVGE